MNLLTTFAGSMMEGFLPQRLGPRQDRRLLLAPRRGDRRAAALVASRTSSRSPARSVADFDVMLGHEIATAIRRTRDQGRRRGADPAGRADGDVPLGRLLPQGVGRRLRPRPRLQHGRVERPRRRRRSRPTTPARSRTRCRRPSTARSASRTVPESQRWFATPDRLPALRRADRRAEGEGGRADRHLRHRPGLPHRLLGAPLRRPSIASVDDWKAQTHRLGARLHPLTIEQNALTSFKSRTTLVPAFANTIGPGLFLQADRIIGGADGVFDRGMQWQGTSLWMTLRYGPDPWVPSSFMPTLARPPVLPHGPGRARWSRR